MLGTRLQTSAILRQAVGSCRLRKNCVCACVHACTHACVLACFKRISHLFGLVLVNSISIIIHVGGRRKCIGAMVMLQFTSHFHYAWHYTVLQIQFYWIELPLASTFLFHNHDILDSGCQLHYSGPSLCKRTPPKSGCCLSSQLHKVHKITPEERRPI